MIILDKEKIKELLEVRGFTGDNKTRPILNCVLLKLDGNSKTIELTATDSYMAIKKVIQLDTTQDFESCNILIENKVIDLIKKEEKIIISETNNTILLNSGVVYPFVLTNFNDNYPEIKDIFDKNIDEEDRATISLGVEALSKMLKALKNNDTIQLTFKRGSYQPCMIKEDFKEDTSILLCPLRSR